MLEKFLPRIEFDSYEDFKANYKVNVPEDFNFGFDIVDAWANEDENKKALVWCDDDGNERIFTFKDISLISNKIANFFVSKGIKKGDVVFLILRRKWQYWVSATALHKIGAILIPGTLQLTAKDIAYRVNAADINSIICLNDDFVKTQIREAREKCPKLKHVFLIEKNKGADDDFESFEKGFENMSDVFKRPLGEDATKATDTMLVYFTSGTTGMPKMVEHNFAYPLGHIVTAKYWQQVQENKLHMSVSDSGWAKFGWGKIYGQWICGAVIFAYDMKKFVPSNLLKMLEKYKVSTFCAPPTMFRFMLQEHPENYDLSSIEHCGVAGEPLNPEVFKKWQALTGLELREGFGQSESSVMLANFQWFDVYPGSTGKPSPLYNIELVSKDGTKCFEGDEGRIVVKGVEKYSPPGLFVGYYKNEELTKKAFEGGDYDTGDMAWQDSNGYYWFIGRNDDVIKCSGYRIGPFEVESALLEHESVVECAITAVPDPIRGQVVKATVVLKKGYTPSDSLVKELQNYVKHTTAPYKYPRIVEFVDELPKTIGGKIKRAHIRETDRQIVQEDEIPKETK